MSVKTPTRFCLQNELMYSTPSHVSSCIPLSVGKTGQCQVLAAMPRHGWHAATSIFLSDTPMGVQLSLDTRPYHGDVLVQDPAPAEVAVAQIVVAVPAVAMAAGRKRLLITAAAVATAAR